MRKDKLSQCERESLLLLRDHLTILGFYLFGVDSISEEVAGFSPLWFPKENSVCLLSLLLCLCFIVVHVILSVKDTKIIMLA